MSENNVKWAILKESVRGVSHEKNGLPNQDSIFCVPQNTDSSQSYPYILCVSDGHGSLKSFRSDKGSQFAVFSCAQIMLDFIKESKGASLSFIKNTIEGEVVKKIHNKWTEWTKNNNNTNPFNETEIERVREKYDEKVMEEILEKPQIAYGATLLSVVVTEEYMIFLQNGDGDIIVVMEDGETLRPLPGDPRLIANETTSLSSETAWKDFRIAFQVLSERIPKLILLSSDGYANSFVSDADFMQVGKDMLEVLQNDGVENVGANLKEWLYDASKNGSGDDVSLGILYRLDTDNVIDDNAKDNGKYKDKIVSDSNQ